MTSPSDRFKAPTRRAFAKSIAAAFVAVPFASLWTNARELISKEPARDHTSPQVGPQEVSCLPGTAGGEPHEPPIIISGGSLIMECERRMIREGGVKHPPREHLYEFDEYHYGRIVSMQVLTEYRDVFTSRCFNVTGASESRLPELKIWLQRAQGGDWVANDIDPSKTDAHIFFTYVTEEGLPAAVVEIDKKLKEQKSFKPSRPFRHSHKGYGSNVPLFRIGRWRLAFNDGTLIDKGQVGPVRLDDRGDEVLGFKLVPRFHHVGPEILRRRSLRR